jgi:hypothetical protein
LVTARTALEHAGSAARLECAGTELVRAYAQLMPKRTSSEQLILIKK